MKWFALLVVLVAWQPEAMAGSGSFKTEVKLLVPDAAVGTAMELWAMPKHPGKKVSIYFFDTPTGTLATNGLILRARQPAEGRGDSVVKVRTTGDTGPISELDWTDETQPLRSFSVANPRTPADLAVDKTPVNRLFNPEQRKLVETRLPGFQWNTLRRFGPILAEVWDQRFQLPNFSAPVTVEHWRLISVFRMRDILEISTRDRTPSVEASRAFAHQFYTAAAAARLGQPSGETKTTIALEFFRPPPANLR